MPFDFTVVLFLPKTSPGCTIHGSNSLFLRQNSLSLRINSLLCCVGNSAQKTPKSLGRSRIPGSNIVPTGSTCFSGLKPLCRTATKCRRDSSRNASRVRWEPSQLLAKHCVVPIRRIGFWHSEPQEKHRGHGNGCDAQKSRRATKASGNEAC
jgi:hypothetical protein